VRVGIYSRISSDTEGLGLGVGRQEEDARTVAGLRGWDVACVYQDNDYSAFNVKVKRPEFERLLADLERGGVDGVVAYDLDRFSRQPADLERAIRIFDTRPGLVFATVQQDLDLSTSDGRTMARVMVAFANKSSMDTSRRIKRKNLELAQRGVPRSTRRPFGYQDDKVTIRPAEAELVRQAARDVLAGVGLHTIARRWNEQGVRTPYGNQWLQSVLKSMLVSPRMAGFRIHQKQIARDADGRPVMTKREPLLDVSTWESVCAVLNDPERTRRHTYAGGRKRLLSGLVRCGTCGVSMSCDKDFRRGIHTYVCKQQTTARGCGTVAVSGPRMDELVTALVLRYLSDRAVVPEVSPWVDEQQLQDVTTRISELMAAFTAGELTGAVVFPAVSKLEAQAEELREARATWLRDQAFIVNRPENVTTAWPELDVDRQRAVIESVISAVVVKPAAKKGGRFDPSRVEVVWR
jgi:site-specific DNA recombinase